MGVQNRGPRVPFLLFYQVHQLVTQFKVSKGLNKLVKPLNDGIEAFFFTTRGGRSITVRRVLLVAILAKPNLLAACLACSKIEMSS